MLNLKVLTENATAKSKGFVAEQVVTDLLAHEYKEQGCSFCLRLLNQTGKPSDSDAGVEELYSIISNLSGGASLSLMPLFKVDAESSDVQDAIKKLEEVGFPESVTVWLDEKSIQELSSVNSDSENAKNIREDWKKGLSEAGYSIGYYFDNNVLEAVDYGPFLSGSSLNGNAMKTVSIGDNLGAYEIRWAFLSSDE